MIPYVVHITGDLRDVEEVLSEAVAQGLLDGYRVMPDSPAAKLLRRSESQVSYGTVRA